ncbi:MAG: hypothetical protein HY731_13080 [Candidatus Tectomicrobia bacterium]|nr:hypothetical protein [Candidatus Tectomicrobia bacterium]
MARLLIFLLLTGSIASGCSGLRAENRKVNVSPLFRYDYNAERQSTQVRALGPFIAYRQDQEEKEYSVRPFIYSRVQKREKSELTDIVFPFGRREITEEKRSFYLLPFVSQKTFPEKKEIQVFPLISGQTEKGESYFAIFPIYGNLKERFGKDQIRFVLWPLYMETKDGEKVTRKVLWPFFSQTSGEGVVGSKVWPLYGYEKKAGEFAKYSFLWPLLTYEKKDLSSENPSETFAFLPFYLNQKTSSGRTITTMLYPFFTTIRDEEGRVVQRDAPWPLFQWAKDGDRESLQFFPLIGRKRQGEAKRFFFLWPLYKYQEDSSGEAKSRAYTFLLINTYREERAKKNDEMRQSLKVWPLFTYEKDQAGSRLLSFPHLIPFQHAGFERNYGPLLRLYYFERDDRGKAKSDLLWGLYSREKTPSTDLIDLSFLFSYKRSDEAGSELSILEGLVTYKALEQEKSMRFFFLPWVAKWESRKGEIPVVTFDRRR